MKTFFNSERSPYEWFRTTGDSRIKQVKMFSFSRTRKGGGIGATEWPTLFFCFFKPKKLTAP